MKYLVILILFFSYIPVHAQSSDSKGVSISVNPEAKPDPSAILDVNNENELLGVKVAKFDFTSSINNVQDLFNEMTLQILNPSSGLLFYSGQQSLEGLVYFETKSQSWNYLGDEGKKMIGIPDGTIIMFSGDIDELFTPEGVGFGEAENWYICNGDNNTPDLRGAFVKGYNGAGENSLVADNNIGDDNRNTPVITTISQENVSQHTHDLEDIEQPLSHNHTIMNVGSHDGLHHIDEIRRGKYLSYKKRHEGGHTNAKRYQKSSKEVKSKSSGDAGVNLKDTKYSGPVEQVDNTPLLTLPDAAQIQNGVEQLPKWVSDYDGKLVGSVDTRPAYFMVIYIMKQEKKLGSLYVR